ncbi:hypothetical protein DFH06DRAFT_1337557 [Mycena polygramma]|nr:hypothetical protein DFH06DRAFT_1337557 [Mycena polygramma]
MSAHRNYYPSDYNSLRDAIPSATQPNSSSGHHGGAMPPNQMYPQPPMNQGHPSSQPYPPGYGGQPSGASAQQNYGGYPNTPYNPGLGQQYNMQHPPSQPQHYGSNNAHMPPSSASPYGGTQYPPNYPYAGQDQYAGGPAPDPGMSIKQCYNCGKTSTPLWRRDPQTQRTLCNACGLYLQQRREPRPQALIDADAEATEDYGGGSAMPAVAGGPECSHCGTRETSVWRRNEVGEQVCNACGVYKRLRGVDRPVSLRKNKVKPRAKHSG